VAPRTVHRFPRERDVQHRDDPEFGAKLGAAYGAFLGADKTVVTSRDADNVSRMMNRSIICGLLSAGVNTMDLRATSIPLLRQELSSGKEAGGIHVAAPRSTKTSPTSSFLTPTERTSLRRRPRRWSGSSSARTSRARTATRSARSPSPSGPRRPTRRSSFPRWTWRRSTGANSGSRSTTPTRRRNDLPHPPGVVRLPGGRHQRAPGRPAHHAGPVRVRSPGQAARHIVTSLKYDLGCLIDAAGRSSSC